MSRCRLHLPALRCDDALIIIVIIIIIIIIIITITTTTTNNNNSDNHTNDNIIIVIIIIVLVNIIIVITIISSSSSGGGGGGSSSSSSSSSSSNIISMSDPVPSSVRGRCAVSSPNFNSQTIKSRVSNPRTIAYFRIKMPFEGSDLPGAGPILRTGRAAELGRESVTTHQT